jgi:tRNA acetyltransferase TAN1
MSLRIYFCGDNLIYKYNPQKIIEPNWAGIYVTCVRGHEAQCRNEMMNLFAEYTENEEIQESVEEVDEDEDIESAIAKEVGELKEKKRTSAIIPIDIGCECVLFFRTKSPIDPVQLVRRICSDAATTKTKRTRYAQRLTPITRTGTANMEGLKRLSMEVLKPHFHQEDQQPIKYAIRTTQRNHNVLNRDEIIQTVAEQVGKNHPVDLKDYDKLILVECFKSSLGMAVVSDFDQLERFNLQQIFEKTIQIKSD